MSLAAFCYAALSHAASSHVALSRALSGQDSVWGDGLWHRGGFEGFGVVPSGLQHPTAFGQTFCSLGLGGCSLGAACGRREFRCLTGAIAEELESRYTIFFTLLLVLPFVLHIHPHFVWDDDKRCGSPLLLYYHIRNLNYTKHIYRFTISSFVSSEIQSPLLRGLWKRCRLFWTSLQWPVR